MTLRRGESCGSGVQCTMVGHKKEDNVTARDSRLHSVPLVAVGERVAIGFKNSASSQTALEDGDDGKRKQVDPRPTAELFLRR